jgi:NADPH:quinone reductase-like Zn-dependent oxidoreductase
MKALRYHAVGSLDHVRFDEIEPPACGPDETLVKVAAAGVNPIDAKIPTSGMAGQSTPRTLGIDFAGTVVGSDRFAKGMRVFGSGNGFGVRRDGSFAEFVCVQSDGLVELDDSISFETAASLGVVFLTAHECILGSAAATRSGETVVVHGAGGGLGQACVQIASKIAAARTIAVVSSADGDALARSLGAAETIDRKRVDVPEAIRSLTEGRGADVIVDLVGGAVFEASVVLLAPHGRLVAVGLSAGAERRVQFDLVEFYRANRRIIGVTSSSFAMDERARRLREVASWLRDGKIVAPVIEVVPFDRARDALARTMAPEGVHGKLVLKL